MTDLLSLYSSLHRAHEHGIAIVPGDLETVDYIADAAERCIVIARHVGGAGWDAAVAAALAEVLPSISAEIVSQGATALAVRARHEPDHVVDNVVPLMSRPRGIRTVD